MRSRVWLIPTILIVLFVLNSLLTLASFVNSFNINNTNKQLAHWLDERNMAELRLEKSTPTPPCLDPYASLYNRVEDLFCLKLPKFLPQFKNPCFYTVGKKSQAVLNCLPYFYILGIDKSGTTDLHSRLMAHPAVRNNRGTWDKETRFWSRQRLGVKGIIDGRNRMYLQEYLAFFANTSTEIQNGGTDNTNSKNIITGDATPMHFWEFHYWHLIPQNVKKEEPVILTPHLFKYIYHDRNPKMIIQLREPIERMRSRVWLIPTILIVLFVLNSLLTLASFVNSFNINNTNKQLAHWLDERNMAELRLEKSTPTPPCLDPYASLYNRVEDLFCLKLPKFLPQFKNPCFYTVGKKSQAVLNCLPYFYILGIDKSGTTDLHSRLMAHPAVRNNRGTWDKETRFWSRQRLGVKGIIDGRNRMYLQEYLAFFANTSTEIQNGGTDNTNSKNIITGDATPMHFWEFHYWHLIPQNVKKEEPVILTPHLFKYIYHDRNPKMIIQLREPIERLYSDYIFLKLGENPQTFHDHVLKSVSVLTECFKNRGQRLCLFDVNVHKRLPTRLHIGCYSSYLKEWLKVYPLSSFHITRFEDYEKDLKGSLRGVFSYLEIEPLPDKDLDKIVALGRKQVTKGKKGRVLPETFTILHKFYLPFVQETASILNNKQFLWEDVYKERVKPGKG